MKDTISGGGLYLIRFDGTPYYYGGRATSFRKRWAAHLCDLRASKHHNPWIQRVFDKHGPPEFLVIAQIPTGDAQIVAEQRWLDKHFGSVGCLNLSKSSEGASASFVWVNNGAINRRTTLNEASTLVAAGWVRGRKMGSKSRNRRSTRTEAEVEGARRAGEKRRGRPHNPDAIRKTADANRGRKNSLVALENLRLAGLARRGRKRDPTLVAMVAESNKGRCHTAESKKRMREAKARLVEGMIPPDGVRTSDLEILQGLCSKPLSITDLIVVFPYLKVNAIRQRIHRCKRAGLLESVSRGRYALTIKAQILYNPISGRVSTLTP